MPSSARFCCLGGTGTSGRCGHRPLRGSARACLKIGDVPSGEGFWAAGKQFFRGNPDGFQGKIAPSSGQKARRLGLLTCFKQAPKPRSVGTGAPGQLLLPLRVSSPSAHIGPTYARLMHLPCNPFLYLIFCQASGGPLDGSLLAAKPLRPTLQTCHWHVCFTLRCRFPPS